MQDDQHSSTRPQGPVLALGAASHVGRQRVTNEDAYCLLAGINAPPGALIAAAVADGMGGHRAGEVASNMAIKELSRLFGQRRFQAPVPEGQSPLGEDVHTVNRELYRASRAPSLAGMGTTLTAGVMIEEILYVAHVGDSRAYLYRDGQLQRLTNDHSWAAEQVLAGRLTPEQAAGHPGRNVLTRAVGVQSVVQVDFSQVVLKAQDTVLLCSDGLYTQVAETDIRDVLQKEQPQAACDRFVEWANRQGGKDNVTTIVIRVDKLAPQGSDGSPEAGIGLPLVKRLSGAWARLGRATGVSKDKGESR